MSKKIIYRYKASDIATIVNDFVNTLQSAEGDQFKSVHAVDDTVIVKIGIQTFIINIIEKDNLN